MNVKESALKSLERQLRKNRCHHKYLCRQIRKLRNGCSHPSSYKRERASHKAGWIDIWSICNKCGIRIGVKHVQAEDKHAV
jgi:hypothetical protein